MAELLPDKDLLAKVSQCYPSVLADPYVRLNVEITRLQVNWYEVFSRMIDSFEISVMFLGLVSMSAYLRGSSSRSEAAVNQVLLKIRDNPTLSTGHWWELLRETLRTHYECSENCPVQPLAKAYFKTRDKMSKLATALNEITSIRNKKKGHTWTLEESEYEEISRKYFPILEFWHSNLGYLENFWLINVRRSQRVDKETFRCEAELLCGSRRFYGNIHFDSSAGLIENQFYMVPSLDRLAKIEPDFKPDEELFVPLHPFVLISREENNRNDILLFIGKDKHPTYMSVIGSKRSGFQEYSDDFAKSFDRIESSDGRESLPPKLAEYLTPCLAAARLKTREYIDAMENAGVYQPRFYMKRKGFEGIIKEFLSSDKAIMIVGGVSGIGKSNFICHFADEQLENADPACMVLLLGPKEFPQSYISLDRTLRDILGIHNTIKEWIQGFKKLSANERLKLKVKLLIIIDGLDKHESISTLLKAVNIWVESFKFEEFQSVIQLKVIVTSTPVGLAQIKATDSNPYLEQYYAPVRGIVTGDKNAGVPSISMLGFDPEDLEEAYKLYRQNEGFQPQTEFRDLQHSARRALTHPLFLRLAMEVYDNENIPSHPISNRTLHKYCQRFVFTKRSTKYFVEHLVEKMLSKKSRAISIDDICEDNELRDYILLENENAPFEVLCRDHVLSRSVHKKYEYLSFSQVEYVEFTIDRVFQYLLVDRVLDRFKFSDDGSSGITQIVEYSIDFPSLRSGIVDLLTELAQHEDFKHFDSLLNTKPGSDAWLVSLFTDVYISLVEEEYDKPETDEEDETTKQFGENGEETLAADKTEEVSPPGGEMPATDKIETDECKDDEAPEVNHAERFMGELLKKDHAFALKIIYQSATILFRQGRWNATINLLEQAAEDENNKNLEKFALNNRLVILYKNKDQWKKALDCSDRNEKLISILAGSISEQQLSRHRLNRFSVLYDMGKRKVAMDLCTDAFNIAVKNNLAVEIAATANNLGIASVYFDKPTEAEEVLNTGIAANPENDMLMGHLYINRGFVRLFVAQVGDRNFIESKKFKDAEDDFILAAERFQRIDYTQGILYSHSTDGLMLLHKGQWQEAKNKLDESLKRADEMMEKWPHYGTEADLALLHYYKPDGDLKKAIEHADNAYSGTEENEDPEGIAITGMILARMLIDRWDDGDADRACALLESAEKTMGEGTTDEPGLMFHSAAAIACAGMIELLNKQGKPTEEWEQKKDNHCSILDKNIYRDFARVFNPYDWKLLFLAELH